jgi:hypothetical protein
VSIARKTLRTAIGSLLSCTEKARIGGATSIQAKAGATASGVFLGSQTHPVPCPVTLTSAGVQMKRSDERLDVVDTKGSERHERYFSTFNLYKREN